MRSSLVRIILQTCVGALVLLVTNTNVYAYQPMLEDTRPEPDGTSLSTYFSAMPIGDPTFSALAVFGKLQSGDEVDLYAFTPQNDTIIPIEVLVPKTENNRVFTPTLAIIGSFVPPLGDKTSYPLSVPNGMDIAVYAAPTWDTRTTIYDPIAFLTLYNGTPGQIPTTPGQLYFIAVYDPNGSTGSYVLKMGDTMNFSASAYDFAPNLLWFPLEFAGESERNTPSPFDAQVERYLNTAAGNYDGFRAVDGRIRLGFQYLTFFLYRLNLLFGG